jgi:magnesium transporter
MRDTKSILDNIREYTDMLKGDELRQLVADLPVADLLEIWESLAEQERTSIFLLLDLERKVDLLNGLSNVEQERLIERLPMANMKLLLREMEPDDLVDVIQTVSPEVRQAVWSSLSDDAKRETEFLLRWDEDDAAGLMTPRYVAVRSNLTVGQAMQFVRRSIKDVETIYYIYVVDELKRLVGVVSLRNLLGTDDQVRLVDVMVDEVVSVREETDQEEVARVLESYGLIAIPVVDRFSRLLGIVTFDDVIDVIREEQTEDIYKMASMEGGTEKYLESSVWGLVKKRIPWLAILLVAGTITTNVLDAYQPLILGAAFLALFIPVITQTGGNSGTQSATLIIRGLATGDIHFHEVGRVLAKELAVGVVLGLCMGIIIVARSVFLPPGIGLFQGLVIGLSLIFVVIFSTIIGAFAPLLIHKLGFDPAVMAGPLMATVIDVIGLTIYFETARLVLGL